MEREEKIINARVVKKDDKIEIIIDDYKLVGYLYDWAEEWEVKFDTDRPDKPLLVIKFFVRER